MNAHQQKPDVATKHDISASARSTAIGLPDWLCLAAAPTFAIMALLTAVFEGGGPTCSARGKVHGPSVEWCRCTC